MSMSIEELYDELERLKKKYPNANVEVRTTGEVYSVGVDKMGGEATIVLNTK